MTGTTASIARRGAIAAMTGCFLALALAGCARTAQPDLALACQIRKCTCLAVNPNPLMPDKGEEVRWKANGDAYCREGFVLRRVTE